MQSEIGRPLSPQNDRRGSRMPAAGSWGGANSNILPAPGGSRTGKENWKGQALQSEIGRPLSPRNDRRGSRMPAAGSWGGELEHSAARRGIHRAQASRRDPNCYAVKGSGCVGHPPTEK